MKTDTQISAIIKEAEESIDALNVFPAPVVLHLQFRTIEVDMVLEAVLEYFDLQLHDLQGRSRKEHIAEARAVFVYLKRTLIEDKATYEQIGKILCRDHSTALFLMRKMQGLVDIADTRAMEEIKTITQMITIKFKRS